jgi:hypothetical protein
MILYLAGWSVYFIACKGGARPEISQDMNNQIRLYRSYAYGQRSIWPNGGVSDIGNMLVKSTGNPIIAAGGKNHLPIVRVSARQKRARHLTDISADGIRCALCIVAHHMWCSSSVHASSSCESVQDTVTSNLSCTIRYNSQKGIKGWGGRPADLPDSWFCLFVVRRF